MRRLALAALLAVMPAAAPAQPQEVEACLAQDFESGGWENCIGVISGPCMDRPDGQSTAGMVECLAAETQAWDAVLNADYRKLMSMLDEAQQKAVRDAQRAWIASRDLDCAVPWAIEPGTLSRPWGASCMMEMTARRVMWVRSFLDYMSL